MYTLLSSHSYLGALSNDKFFYSGGWYRSDNADDMAAVTSNLMTLDLNDTWKWDAASISEVDSTPDLFSSLAPTPAK